MNNRHGAHILLVDDYLDFVKEYSETLQNQCRTDVVYATNAEDAIALMKQHPIKVAILDQLMPIKGTELFGMLKQIDSRVKTILLTAGADPHDLTKVTNIGFDYALLKDEEDMVSLPTKVLLLIMRYNSEGLMENPAPFHVEEIKTLFRRKHTVSYSIIGYETIMKEFVPNDGWLTRNLIERGTILTLEEEFSVEKDFNFTNSFHMCAESNIGIDNDHILKFTASLAAKMEQTLKSTYTEKMKHIIKRNTKFEMPVTSEDMVSRLYEYAKVYSMMKVYLQKNCSCCQSCTIDAITVYFPVPIVRYRIREYFENGVNREIDSGELRG